MSIVERERVETEVVTTPVTTRDVLLRAAYDIEMHGWFKLGKEAKSFRATPGVPSRCVLSAILMAAETYGTDFLPSLLRFEAYVGARPHTWNDAPGRTQKDVVAALSQAAA